MGTTALTRVSAAMAMSSLGADESTSARVRRVYEIRSRVAIRRERCGTRGPALMRELARRSLRASVRSGELVGPSAEEELLLPAQHLLGPAIRDQRRAVDQLGAE